MAKLVHLVEQTPDVRADEIRDFHYFLFIFVICFVFFGISAIESIVLTDIVWRTALGLSIV